jgi:hypothetical protein
LIPRFVAATFCLVAALSAAGCSADPYPLRAPAGASQWSPVAVGAEAEGVVLYLELKPGDRMELISAEAVGLPAGTTATFFYAPGTPSVGGGWTIGDVLEPIAGATLSTDASASPGPGNDVGVVAKLSSSVAGFFELTNLRLSFRINGGQVQTKEGISVTLGICVADPAPTTCEPPATP